MIHRSSPTLLACIRWLVFLMSAIALGTSACASTGTAPSARPTEVADRPAVTTRVPGIPNRPDLATVVPFYWKEHETQQEKTKVVIPAEVDGRRGIFILDLGSNVLALSRTFLQPTPTGVAA